MKLLLDTHLLLWGVLASPRLPKAARLLIESPDHQPLFSSASLWEIAIKASQGRPNFQIDPRQLRRILLDNGYDELSITSLHAVAVTALPAIHKDPFDRMLVAQSIVEGITLLTVDSVIARYPAPIHKF